MKKDEALAALDAHIAKLEEDLSFARRGSGIAQDIVKLTRPPLIEQGNLLRAVISGMDD